MNFCPECQNLMYPRSANRRLFYTCQNCGVQEEVQDPLVSKTLLTSVENIQSKMPNKDIILDPTLPRSKDYVCPDCGKPEPVYFQPSDESMTLIYACTNRTCARMGPMEEFRHKDA